MGIGGYQPCTALKQEGGNNRRKDEPAAMTARYAEKNSRERLKLLTTRKPK
jgi:hypothetical protein